MKRKPALLFTSLLVAILLAGCAGQAQGELSSTSTATVQSQAAAPTASPAAAATATATKKAAVSPPTPTPLPTSTLQAPEPTLTPTVTPTLGPCDARLAAEDEGLLTLVSRTYGLSRDYVPADLVPLSNYFPNSVTLGYPTEVREIIIEPLREIIEAMQAEGLNPQIISGYRGYAAQSLALQKWLEQYPDWATHLSAPPGHSEHQLGTTVDFGSPELAEMVGEEFIQFHPAFDSTSEGRWLAQHAHDYGWTMSYPAGAFERTEFYYEPWHFRYVGRELAQQLFEQELTISEHLLQLQPEPCIP